LVRHFGPASRAFARLPNMSVDLRDAVDHSLYGTAAAQYVIDRCTGLLAGWRAPAELAAPEKTKHLMASHSRKRRTESTL
ncbi:alpha/beta hydrolase, partial [Burkholderia cepacia]